MIKVVNGNKVVVGLSQLKKVLKHYENDDISNDEFGTLISISKDKFVFKNKKIFFEDINDTIEDGFFLMFDNGKYFYFKFNEKERAIYPYSFRAEKEYQLKESWQDYEDTLMGKGGLIKSFNYTIGGL